MFQAPGGGGAWVKPAQMSGHLILVTRVTDVDDHHFDSLKNQGRGGEVTKITFDYVDLDGDQLLVEDALDSHPGIVSRLKKYNGQPEAMVLARMAQAPSKSGNPAWVLDDATSDQAAVARATQWVTTWRAGSFAPPQTATPPVAPPPAPGAVATPPAAPTPPAAQPAATQQTIGGVTIPGNLDPATLALLQQVAAQQGASA